MASKQAGLLFSKHIGYPPPGNGFFFRDDRDELVGVKFETENPPTNIFFEMNLPTLSLILFVDLF